MIPPEVVALCASAAVDKILRSGSKVCIIFKEYVNHVLFIGTWRLQFGITFTVWTWFCQGRWTISIAWFAQLIGLQDLSQRGNMNWIMVLSTNMWNLNCILQETVAQNLIR